MSNQFAIALTGGPGGGKTTIIEELSGDPVWQERFRALPEAISLIGGRGFSIREKSFQREMVRIQMTQEDKLVLELAGASRVILCHRGSLDPLAYWLDRGWSEQEFFEYTGTTREEHYRRYTAVIHLVTAANGAENAYRRWPDAHRHETAEQSILLDNLLGKVWQDHPKYYRLDNNGVSWFEKSQKAKDIIRMYLLGDLY